MGHVVRHFLHCDDVGFVAELVGGVDHLTEAAARVENQLVRQHHGEGLVADDVARAPHRMAEPVRGLLAGEAHCAGGRLELLQQGDLGRLVAGLERGVEFEHPVEMILDDALVASGHEHEMLDAGFAGFIDDVLDQRPIDDRQHFLRHRLGGGQDAGAETGNREHGFAYLHASVSRVGMAAGGLATCYPLCRARQSRM